MTNREGKINISSFFPSFALALGMLREMKMNMERRERKKAREKC
jgi:hypothetical protein